MLKTFISPSFGELKPKGINFDSVAPKEVFVTYKPNTDVLNFYVQPDYHQYFHHVYYDGEWITVSQKAPDTLKVIVSSSSTYGYGEYTVDTDGMELPKEITKLVPDARFYKYPY